MQGRIRRSRALPQSILAVAMTLLLAGCSTPAHSEGLDPQSEIGPFAAQVAKRHALNEQAVRATLAEARVLPRVLEAISTPAEAKPWKDYRPIFIVERRIAAGAQYWREHAATLDDASARFGVPQRVIVAIIGVETLYGQRAGNIRVLDALATLGFRYPRRATFFRRELEQFLVLAGEESLDPLGVAGSYAGAMGIGQFIPSSYREYAVDFDGDGRRDLLSSHEDAIGSVAAYLSRHGWQRGAPVAAPARLASGPVQDILAKGEKPHLTLSRLAARGVTPVGEVNGAPSAALIDLEGSEGTEHWIVFQNFYAITRYNRSKLYAMAVHQLSEAIEARYGKGAS